MHLLLVLVLAAAARSTAAMTWYLSNGNGCNPVNGYVSVSQYSSVEYVPVHPAVSPRPCLYLFLVLTVFSPVLVAATSTQPSLYYSSGYSLMCTATFYSPQFSRISVAVSWWSFGYYDGLIVYDGDSTEASPLVTMAGTSYSYSTYTSTGPYVTIKFFVSPSSGYWSFTGAQISLKVVDSVQAAGVVDSTVGGVAALEVVFVAALLIVVFRRHSSTIRYWRQRKQSGLIGNPSTWAPNGEPGPPVRRVSFPI
jgi:hypothetical protein